MVAEWWENLKRSVMPVSHAEALVNEIYENPAQSIQPDPYYDVRDLSSPNVYVQAKGAVKDTVTAIQEGGQKYFLMIAALLLIAIILNAAVPAFIRR